MTYYSPKLDKQRKIYKSNIGIYAENDTYSPFCLYIILRKSKNYETSTIGK